MNGQPVGLIAGWGRFPVVVAEKAQRCGIPVIGIGILGMADRKAIEPFCSHFYWTRLASMNRPVRCMKAHGVTEYTMAGKVHKVQIFGSNRFITMMPDMRMLRFWYRRRQDNSDDTLLLGIIREYETSGLFCKSALDICPELLVQPGTLTSRTPTNREEADIEYGWALAKEMGRLDVGQSVCVRDRAVIAVEAIEGTDASIRRAGELCKVGGIVVVKVAKPQQDMRFDVPTVGPSTIESMKVAGAKVLAVEASKTIFIDEAQTIAAANEAGIAIVARNL